MMRFVRGLGIGLAAVAGAVLVALVIVYGLSEIRIRKSYDIALSALVPSQDADLIETGRHLATTRGCTECHGADLGGKVIIDAPVMALISASNLTSGSGGVGSRYSEAALERAIRHGVSADGRALAIMPAKEYFSLGEEDVAAIVAYIKSVPPVSRELPARKFGPLGRFLLVTNQMPMFPAEQLDHAAPRPMAPPVGETVEYGRYVAAICAGCHGDGFSGGISPSGPPDSPPAANLTAHETGLASWTEEDFFRALREGQRPDGSQLDPEVMPWMMTSYMTDSELRALWIYFRSLPPTEFGNR